MSGAASVTFAVAGKEMTRESGTRVDSAALALHSSDVLASCAEALYTAGAQAAAPAALIVPVAQGVHGE